MRDGNLRIVRSFLTYILNFKEWVAPVVKQRRKERERSAPSFWRDYGDDSCC